MLTQQNYLWQGSFDSVAWNIANPHIISNIILNYRGVNMYAMLVGKLPFRSPRQGTKKRQKLLEQISSGLSESHEKEMSHISSTARDLVGRLLQPDPRRRIHLGEVMLHPWVTKDGSHPLHPYQEEVTDQSTKNAVSEYLS